MIVEMKKATLLLSATQRKEALAALRKLGVMHVHHIQAPASEEIDALQKDHAALDKALFIISEIESKQKAIDGDAAECVQNILSLDHEKREAERVLNEKNEILKWYEAWGQISGETLKDLSDSGLHLRLYETDKAALKKMPEDVQYFYEVKDPSVHLVTVSEDPEFKLDMKEVRPPKVELDILKSEVEDLKKSVQSLDKQIQDSAAYRDGLLQYQETLNKQLEFSQVLHGMGDETDFVYLQGFCPVDKIDELKSTSESQGWGYILEEPDDPTEVPTLIKSPKPIGIIQPLFKFMDVLPGYHEVDVSLVFLIFFSIFYAMIIGDAGYGLVFLGGTIFARIKAPKNAPAEPFLLFFVLSAATIIWGTLTGTWFGSKAIAEWPILNRFVIDNMYSFNNSTESTQFMMKFTFTLGMIHLVIGRVLAFVKQLPSIKSLAQLGWAMIVVGIYHVANLLVLTTPVPAYVAPLMIGGLCVVGVFANFQKNPLKLILSFISTVLNSLLDVISSFSDVVSYIRLFAVGIASVTVAASFNNMASGIGAPIVLLLGHGLNIVLGLMSVMVHGVRLNMLEFSGHLGQEWTGKEYKPFSE